MQIHELKLNPKKSKKRIARGGKRGAYSGRGLKGQISRSGHRVQPIIRQFLKRYPKLRGYRFKIIDSKPIVIDLALIELKWDANKVLTPKTLVEANLISQKGKTTPKIKILGDGNLTKKIRVAGCYVSKQAKEKIEKLGGHIVPVKEYVAPKKVKKVKVKKENAEQKAPEGKVETKAKKPVKVQAEKKPAKSKK